MNRFIGFCERHYNWLVECAAGGEDIEPGDGEGAGAAVQSGAPGPQLELGVPLCVHHQQGHDQREYHITCICCAFQTLQNVFT